jgi:hypothetical protein
MKALFGLGITALVIFAAFPAMAERPCRPSLSNMYHCPEPSSPTIKEKKAIERTGRACVPSLSNLWTCPDATEPGRGAARTSKPNVGERERPSTRTVPPGGASGANQYTTEARARTHCPGDTVVWANTRSHIYHFRGTSYYGNTVSGAYMCEQDALAEGIRAAMNETHP